MFVSLSLLLSMSESVCVLAWKCGQVCDCRDRSVHFNWALSKF